MIHSHKPADPTPSPETPNRTHKEQIERLNWELTVRQLRRAYDAARSSFDAELVSEVDMFGLRDRYHAEATESSLNLLRHGFALMLYHSWERHAVDWSNWTGIYKHGHTSQKLVEMGYVVSPGLNKLNSVANCIKHNNDKLWKQKAHRHMFRPVLKLLVAKAEERNEENLCAQHFKPDYARHLQISDQEMNEFFDSLEKSGPRPS